MKSHIFFIVLTVYLTGLSAAAQNYDFRKTRWGMDSTQVKKAEVSRLVASRKNTLVYSGKLSSWETEIIYNFTNSSKLFHTAYIINLDTRNPQNYVDAFLLLQELLTKVYKEPFDKRFATINGKAITQDEWASNLISDNLYLETKWKTDKTKIVLSLTNVNDSLYLEINYTSFENEKTMDEEKREEILKDL